MVVVSHNLDSGVTGRTSATGSSSLKSGSEAPLLVSASSCRTSSLVEQYGSIRARTEHICRTMETEDYVLQSMTDCSPIRWHLAHTTWFFETFVLAEFVSDYEHYNAEYPYLFNSYYVQAGERFSRPDRGLLSRPTVAEIYAFRSHVDEAMVAFLNTVSDSPDDRAAYVVRVGMNHEQQHQELMMTDIKHALSFNPLRPALLPGDLPQAPESPESRWITFDAGLHDIGHSDASFSYDNEGPVHRYFLEPHALASRTVTNGEYVSFVDDRGYQNQILWLSDGWTHVQEHNWDKPIYWRQTDDGWTEFTLHGERPIDLNAPATHLSYFEADAYARWAGVRLPTEFEWEHAAKTTPVEGHFLENERLHPLSGIDDQDGFNNLYGNTWEWTRSAYSPYPGYRPEEGALGEYNGKFMCNQFVLRGGSCVTSVTHIRPTYRNFFAPHARWQFTGIRLAKDL